MILQARDGRGGRLTATILSGLPPRLALDSGGHVTSHNLTLLFEHFVVAEATAEEWAARAAAGVVARPQ